MVDLTVIRDTNGSLSFKVYRKPTYTGQYIAYDSNPTRSSELAMVRALTRKADRILFTHQAREVEHRRVKVELAENGYTQETYDRGKYRGKRTNNPTKGETPTPDTITTTAACQNNMATNTYTQPESGVQHKHIGHISLPYCKGISDSLARIMRKGGISTSFTTRGSIREQLVHLKDPIAHLDAEGTVYHIQCQGNTDQDCTATYVGETGRYTSECMEGPQIQDQTPHRPIHIQSQTTHARLGPLLLTQKPQF